MRIVILSCLTMLFAGSASAEDWRLVTDDTTSGGTLSAIEVDTITGPPGDRRFSAALWTPELGARHYALGSFTIDCQAGVVRFLGLKMLNAGGEVVYAIADDAANLPTGPLAAGSDQAAALVCEGAAMDSLRFGSAHEFFEWAILAPASGR